MSDILRHSGIALSLPQLEQLWTYHQLLRQYNPQLNLTRIHNFTNMVLKLYADSILPGRLIELPSPLLDLGTGPGMPGIPLKIAFPHLEVLLAESRQKRVDFLGCVAERLQLDGIRIIGGAITERFQEPVEGVITRAVESMAVTLGRIRGCLAKNGLAIFMKGPRCDPEIEEALALRGRCSFQLVKNVTYSIPHTPHERRLVVFRRVDEPPWFKKAEAMKRYVSREIESEQNELFKGMRKILGGRGIKKQQEALVSGMKLVTEILREFPDRCIAWISKGDSAPPPLELAPEHVGWYRLAPRLFDQLDLFGTGPPLLLVRTHPIESWDPVEGFPAGCSLLIPFQDPENVGAAIRSAVAFGVTQIILLAESAHPYHPKALRASGGTVLRARLRNGPALKDLPEYLPLVPLSMEGGDISTISFPEAFGLLAGIEGAGLPVSFRQRAVSIPIKPGVESLNAAAAAAIALYVWSQSVRCAS